MVGSDKSTSLSMFLVAALIIASLIFLTGCSVARLSEELTPATERGPAKVTRHVSAMNAFAGDKMGANEVISRMEPMTIKGNELSTGGSKWSWIDSAGSWYSRSLYIGGAFAFLGTVFTAFGGVSPKLQGIGTTILRGLSWVIPGVGGGIEALIGTRRKKQFKEVVVGGEEFKKKLLRANDSKLTKAQVLEWFRAEQHAAQLEGTQDIVKAMTKVK